ncbi:MAG TPA: bacteriohemerythrin [Terriglobales bacterium]
MPQFNWDSTYSVKIKRFDEDHQELFRIINSLYDGMMARRGQEVLQNVLHELLLYTEKHFTGEEAIMRNAGYPQLQGQIEQHRRFTDKVKELSVKYKAGTIGITVEMLDFLSDWLKRHILGMDKQNSEFLNSKGFA